jgi:hypothetical protein
MIPWPHKLTPREGRTDDTLLLACCLFALMALFGGTCWLCYRVFEFVPFVIALPVTAGIGS